MTDNLLFTRLDLPRPGEWLFHFHEYGQSLTEYIRSNPIKPTPAHQTLVFEPFGTFQPEEQRIADQAVEFARIWFNLETRVEARNTLPRYRWSRIQDSGPQESPVRQYETTYFLDRFMPKHFSDDALCCIGITMADLYPDKNWRFVFGQACEPNRTAVVSMARFFSQFWGEPPDENSNTIALKRTCKVLAHEIAHVLGLAHCAIYRCTMNGCNSLEESDSRPLHMCPECLDKLQWNLNFDAIERYEKLKVFFMKNGIQEEAEWIGQRLHQLQHIL